MKKQNQTKSMIGVLIALIVFALLAIIIPRYYSLRNVQNQIALAEENEIELSAETLEAGEDLGFLTVVNPFDDSMSDFRDKINNDLAPLYEERVKILDKLVGHIEMDSLEIRRIGIGEEKNRRSTQKAKENLIEAKELNQSNRVKSVELLGRAMIYMDGALDTQYHHQSGTNLIHYDVILEDFGIEGKAETLLGLLETMYEYDRAEKHATAYYYFKLYNEEGERLLEEYIKPIVEASKEEATNMYNESRKVSDLRTDIDESDMYFGKADNIYKIENALNDANRQYDKNDFYKAEILYQGVIENAEEYIENYS